MAAVTDLGEDYYQIPYAETAYRRLGVDLTDKPDDVEVTVESSDAVNGLSINQYSSFGQKKYYEILTLNQLIDAKIIITTKITGGEVLEYRELKFEIS